MDGALVLQILARWLHVGTAIVLLGGTTFMRFVLLPAAEKLPTEAHDALRTRLMAGWRIVVHAGVLFLLASGFYNYLVVVLPKHHGDGLYHGLMGTKIILSLVLFFLAEALVGRSAVFDKLRQNRRMWLAVAVFLGVIIVGIAGFLKVRGEPSSSQKGSSQEVGSSQSSLFRETPSLTQRAGDQGERIKNLQEIAPAKFAKVNRRVNNTTRLGKVTRLGELL